MRPSRSLGQGNGRPSLHDLLHRAKSSQEKLHRGPPDFTWHEPGEQCSYPGTGCQAGHNHPLLGLFYSLSDACSQLGTHSISQLLGTLGFASCQSWCVHPSNRALSYPQQPYFYSKDLAGCWLGRNGKSVSGIALSASTKPLSSQHHECPPLQTMEHPELRRQRPCDSDFY